MQSTMILPSLIQQLLATYDYVKTMNKKNILYTVAIVCIVPSLVYQNQATFSKTMQVNSNDLIAPIGGMVNTWSFSVPEEAVNPRLIGQYEVLSGLDVDVEVLEQEGCPAPENSFECVAIYSAPNRDSGNVDIPLTPGKGYYLNFHNPGFLAGERTTQLDFYVQYD